MLRPTLISRWASGAATSGAPPSLRSSIRASTSARASCQQIWKAHSIGPKLQG